MYLKRLRLQNIKCFEDIELSFSPGDDGTLAGWNVLLGVNGTGKTTLLQAAALALLGPVSGQRLLANPVAWVRDGAAYGVIEAELLHNPRVDGVSTGQPRKKPYEVRLIVSGREPVRALGLDLAQPQVALEPGLIKGLNAGPYSGRPGWFSTGYGPFRRLSGASGEDNARILYSGGREAGHITLFRESAALTDSERWLVGLHSRAVDPALPLDRREAARGTLGSARQVIDSLLPGEVRIEEVTTEGVRFVGPSGARVALNQLSDGFRSFLALTIDLLQHVLEEHPLPEVTTRSTPERALLTVVQAEGVVFIDEADAHLHPTWQRDLGFRLREVFPNLQFIVSTHSPFVAQAAHARGLFLVGADTEGRVHVEAPEDSVRGWRADQILLSPLFGLDSTRDPETQALLTRYEALAAHAGRTTEEEAELRALRTQLGERLTAPGDSLEERERQRRMQAYIDARLGGGSR